MIKKISTIAFLSLLLGGCGGGGSDSTAPTSAIDKYVGTWKNSCYAGGAIQESSNGLDAYVIDTIKITKLTDYTANLELRTDAYAASDSTCSGTAIGYVVITGSNTNAESINPSTNSITSSYGQNVLTYVQEATLNDGKKVDQLTLAQSKLSTTAGIVTAGQIKVNTQDFAAATTKLISYWLSTSKLVFSGDDVAYPSSLQQDDWTTYTKQ